MQFAAERSPAYGRPVDRDICAVKRRADLNDPITHFMDDADDSRRFAFSAALSAGMDTLHQQYR